MLLGRETLISRVTPVSVVLCSRSENTLNQRLLPLFVRYPSLAQSLNGMFVRLCAAPTSIWQESAAARRRRDGAASSWQRRGPAAGAEVSTSDHEGTFRAYMYTYTTLRSFAHQRPPACVQSTVCSRRLARVAAPRPLSR
eukprot:6188937-Pleurochrysis_carterae.AAC.3